ncbi:MAG: hypothetical protein ACR2H6_02005 [Pyrinomonadaceae bacterium]
MILESGRDVRASHCLQAFYLELVERVYREEVPTKQVRASRVVSNNQAMVALARHDEDASVLKFAIGAQMRAFFSNGSAPDKN